MTTDLFLTFKTTLNPARLKSVLSNVCRQPFRLTVEAHDLDANLPYRILEAGFSTGQDFDNARLLLQRMSGELMAHGNAAPRRPPEPAPAPPAARPSQAAPAQPTAPANTSPLRRN